MAVQLAAKFSPKVDEVMKAKAKTNVATNNDYSWSGVATVDVYSIATRANVNYNRTASNDRFGSDGEVDTSTQTLTLTQDRAFRYIIDKGNHQESQMVTEVGKMLARHLRERVVPEVDTYRLGKLNAAAAANSKDTIITPGATDKNNAYTNFLTLQENVSDDEAPEEGRVAFMTQKYYNFLKQGNFVLDSETDAKGRRSGSLGTVDGVQIVVVPSGRMPANVDLILTHPSALVAPWTLKDYNVHKDAPGISGWLIEGRFIHDAFVLDNKADAVAVHRTSASTTTTTTN